MYQNAEWSAADEALMRLDIEGKSYEEVTMLEFNALIAAIHFEWQD